ncbi:uncharacterized protein METZ01_LOCUS439223 [marine metagenome]|uniref:Uncharacterized protein n=1 Tax=marine metagenome TaxID=408172 RepID=A0A382YTW3_9ZZZZ
MALESGFVAIESGSPKHLDLHPNHNSRYF